MEEVSPPLHVQLPLPYISPLHPQYFLFPSTHFITVTVVIIVLYSLLTEACSVSVLFFDTAQNVANMLLFLCQNGQLIKQSLLQQSPRILIFAT